MIWGILPLLDRKVDQPTWQSPQFQWQGYIFKKYKNKKVTSNKKKTSTETMKNPVKLTDYILLHGIEFKDYHVDQENIV